MSENEKMLRRLFGVRAWNDAQEAEFNDTLDTLLAEHRAEVETLTRNLADAQKDAHENAEALSSARGAALEEAALDVLRRHPSWDGEAEAIRTLQSRSSSVVPVEKVRGVLDWAADLLTRQGYGVGIIRDIRSRLGIDLDATPTFPSGCVACGGQHKLSEPCTVPR